MLISVVGVVLDFVFNYRGMLALICIAAGAVVMTGIIVAYVFMEKIAAAKNGGYDDEYYDEDYDYDEDDQQDDDFAADGEYEPEDTQFMRSSAQGSRRGFFDRSHEEDEDLDDDFDSTFELDEQSAQPAEDEEEVVQPEPEKRRVFGGKFKRSEVGERSISSVISDARGDVQPEQSDEDDTVTDDLFDELEDNFDTAPAQDEPATDSDEPTPVLSFSDPVPAQQEEEFDEEIADEAEDLTEQAEEETASETASEQSEQPIQEPVSAAPAHAAAAPSPFGSGMVVASQAPGQTLESFFEDMSEEDILYRDCVEVWAADAKLPTLRLMKYINAIDDRRTAELLGKECEYINAMLDRMVYFTQLDMIDKMLNMQEYNFSVLVKECLKRFSPFFMEKKIGLLWKGLDVNVVTDKRWFIFALTQVIFNSVEFTPAGGKIAISAKRNGEWVDLAVDDSGSGIDPEELPYIFTAGFMSDTAENPNDRRTGMGLFIARSVLTKLGGDCMAESTPGKGTRIVMRLPAAPESEEE